MLSVYIELGSFLFAPRVQYIQTGSTNEKQLAAIKKCSVHSYKEFIDLAGTWFKLKPMHQHCKICSACAVKVNILIWMTAGAGHIESDKDQTVIIEKKTAPVCLVANRFSILTSGDFRVNGQLVVSLRAQLRRSRVKILKSIRESIAWCFEGCKVSVTSL